MKHTYSLYEAKAKLSAIIRRVREGHSVVVTWHGEPVAEIRPTEAPRAGLDARLGELAERGILVRPKGRAKRDVRPVARKPGALDRFLADRGE